MKSQQEMEELNMYVGIFIGIVLTVIFLIGLRNFYTEIFDYIIPKIH